MPLNTDDRMWGMLVHLSAFAGHFFPFGHIVGPLIIWLLKREKSAFVNDQGREAVNAQISYTIYLAVAGLLCFLLIGIPLLIAVYIADIVLIIVAAITANNGTAYRYPFILRLVK